MTVILTLVRGTGRKQERITVRHDGRIDYWSPKGNRKIGQVQLDQAEILEDIEERWTHNGFARAKEETA